MTVLSSSQPGNIRNPVALVTGSLGLVASTDLTGFNLVNGTPTILTWVAPNDGLMHRVTVFGALHVTTAETGGQINLNTPNPDGSSTGGVVDAGGHAAGSFAIVSKTQLVPPGATVTLSQNTPLTAGAALAWFELWAS